MSFGIRQTYKPRILVNRNDDSDDTLPVYDHEESRRMVEAMLQVSRKSGSSAISQQELENIIRKSSINPDFFPDVKETVESMMQDRRQFDNINLSNAVNNVHGFSNISTSSVTNAKFRELLDMEFKQDLAKAIGDDNKRPQTDEKEEEEVSQTDSEEDPERAQQKAEDSRTKKMLTMGYPSRASMLRGWDNRKTGSSGGIRRTPYGMVDGF